jgi:hypothetical protein
MWWPFRKAPSDLKLSTGQQETIYDSVGTVSRSHDEEVQKYLKYRRSRGLIQSIAPTGMFGFLCGVAVAIKPSRVSGRHVGRAKVIGAFGAQCGVAGCLMSGVHQALIMANDYNDSLLYSLAGVGVGTTAVIVLCGAALPMATTILLGTCLGGAYAGCDYMKNLYDERWLNNFLAAQSLQQVPIHKIAPELQPAYRSYLFWNRPPEEMELRERQLQALTLLNDDLQSHQLDAMAALVQFKPEFFQWISFPDWWPLKLRDSSDESWAVANREYQAQTTRVYDKLKENPNSFKRIIKKLEP